VVALIPSIHLIIKFPLVRSGNLYNGLLLKMTIEIVDLPIKDGNFP